jgi:stage IV sporulation protein B
MLFPDAGKERTGMEGFIRKIKIKKDAVKIVTLMLAVSWALAVPASAAYEYPRALVPMGHTIGINMSCDGVIVVAVAPESSYASGSSEALRAGDVIKSVAGIEVHSADDFRAAAEKFTEESVGLVIDRQGEIIRFSAKPRKNEDGSFELGVWLRDSIAGIGTLTFYDPEERNIRRARPQRKRCGHGSEGADAAGHVLESTVSGVKPVPAAYRALCAENSTQKIR